MTPSSMEKSSGLAEREHRLKRHVQHIVKEQQYGWHLSPSPYAAPLIRPMSGRVATPEQTKPRQRRAVSAGHVRRKRLKQHDYSTNIRSNSNCNELVSMASKLVVATDIIALPKGSKPPKEKRVDSDPAMLSPVDRVSVHSCFHKASHSDPGPSSRKPVQTRKMRKGSNQRPRPGTSTGSSGSHPSEHQLTDTDNQAEIQTQLHQMRINNRLADLKDVRSFTVNTRHAARRPRDATLTLQRLIPTTPNAPEDDYEADFYSYSSSDGSSYAAPMVAWNHDICRRKVATATQTPSHQGKQTMHDFRGDDSLVLPENSRLTLRQLHNASTSPVSEATAASKPVQGNALRHPGNHGDSVTNPTRHPPSKNRSHEVSTYEIHVITGNSSNAGTNAHVNITLIGRHGNSSERPLTLSKTNPRPFQRGQVDVFLVDSIFLGEIYTIRVSHGVTSTDASWFLDSVVVKERHQSDKAYFFNCQRWFSALRDDGQMIRDLPLTDTASVEAVRCLHHNARLAERLHGNDIKRRAATATTRQYHGDGEPCGNSSSDSNSSSVTSSTNSTKENDRFPCCHWLSEEAIRQPVDGQVDGQVGKCKPMILHMSENAREKAAERSRKETEIESQLKLQRESDNELLRIDNEKRRCLIADAKTRSINKSHSHVLCHCCATKETRPGNTEAVSHLHEEEKERRLAEQQQEWRQDNRHERISTQAEDAVDVTEADAGVDRAAVATGQGEGNNAVSKDTIHLACDRGDLDAVRLLLTADLDLKHQRDERGWLALHIAAGKGHLPVVRYLSITGVDLDAETQTGYTAMHLAALNGHVNCLMVLVAMGCSVNCLTVDRYTPLHLAAMSGHLECVKWLLSNRASLKADDVHGRTPIDMADLHQRHTCLKVMRAIEQDIARQQSALALLRSPSRRRPASSRRLTVADDDRYGSDQSESCDGTWQSDNEMEGTTNEKLANVAFHGEPSKALPSLEERQRAYAQQRQRMEGTGSSFLDSIRRDIDEGPIEDF